MVSVAKYYLLVSIIDFHLRVNILCRQGKDKFSIVQSF